MKIASKAVLGLFLVASICQAKSWTKKIEGLVNDVADQVTDVIEQHEDKLDAIAGVIGNIDRMGVLELPAKNKTCIMRHCMPAITACLADNTCRTNMQCAGECAPMNSTCTFYCSESYQTHFADDVLSCLYVDYDCLTLPPPDAINNVTCRNPTEIVDTVEDELIDGMWYVVRGFNPLYDCYDCQELTFNVNDGQIDYEALFNLIAVNGTEIWLTADMTGEDRSQPGKLMMFGYNSGFPGYQTWYVMHSSADTLMIYYCGDVLDDWHFEGLLIMSKTPTLNPER